MRTAALLVAMIMSLLVASPAHSASDQRLVIDKIDVNSRIVSVGLRGDALDVGRDLWAAYRWRVGVAPCAPGSVAFAVHAYDVPGGRALGNRVSSLRRGDRIRIVRPGRDCAYRVTTSRIVRAGSSVSDCYSFDGPPRGCIITCVNRVGPGNYTHRRVVRFRLEK